MIRKTMADRKPTFTSGERPRSVVAKKWLYAADAAWAFRWTPSGRCSTGGHRQLCNSPEDPEYVAYLEPAVREFVQDEPVSRQETASYGQR